MKIAPRSGLAEYDCGRLAAIAPALPVLGFLAVSPDDVRKLLGKEDYGDENVMGAVLSYNKQGFMVNYLGKEVNVKFSQPH